MEKEKINIINNLVKKFGALPAKGFQEEQQF